MTFFSHRSSKTELLDRTDIPFEDICKNMMELNIINKYLGGHSITIAGLKAVLSKSFKSEVSSKPLLICEIGCGGGDNLSAIQQWCKKRKLSARFIGIDLNKDCIHFARENNKLLNVEWIVSDYTDVQFSTKPDIIFSSLFCHHFKDQALVEQLRWMKKNADIGFFINDLHRHPAAYFSIKFLIYFFSKSYLVKNDAPLSVLRGFKRNEWKCLLLQAEITNYKLQWKWAFRWLVNYNE